MNNEPVAFVIGDNKYAPVLVDTVLKVGTPLYTHPAELTDKEIVEVFDNTFKVRDFEDYFLKFARAILRKAQEK